MPQQFLRILEPVLILLLFGGFYFPLATRIFEKDYSYLHWQIVFESPASPQTPECIITWR